NVHGSILPRWRGAAPIHRAIMAGDEETGVTTMWMDDGIDTGDMCLVGTTPILPEDTVGTLHDRLAVMGAKLLVETLRQVEAGTAPRIKQPEEGVTHAAKLERADEVIDWDRSAEELWGQIRALNPWPGAFTEGPKGTLKIWKASPFYDRRGGGTPGQVVEIIKKRGFVVATGEGFLLIEEVQPPGKGRMEAHAFVNGAAIQVGTRFGEPTA
ncbi:MAG TPA: methionyl-tRNA formyltransferase, partial [Symbiobacteriaceae bacterium]|nr:methionyl-tRNA formyltransferase [Symbiobacteriaceae bacterium]